MFARVLVPLDGSTLAASVLPHIAGLTRAGAEAILLRVVEPSLDAPLVDPLEWRVRLDLARVYLDQVARRLQDETGLVPSVMVEEGCAAERILSVARATDSQLIAVCSHGAGGLNAWNMNSVAFKVAQRSGASLLVVRSYQRGPDPEDAPLTPERYRRILVPLDGSLRAEHVLPAADALAVRLGATLVLAHVVQLPRFIQRRGGDQLDPALADAVEQSARHAEEYLHEIASGLQAHAEVRVLRSHDPAALLHQVVSDEEVDLVIVSAHGHSGQRYWPHGSLATSFMLHGTTSLLVLQDILWDDLVPNQAELAAASERHPQRVISGTLPGQTEALLVE